MGRRSVWSDTRLHEAAARFVPAADEVWRLQTGEDPECRAFQAMADRGHYRAEGGTRQGIYVCTPRGELLASINSNDPGAVLATIERGWDAWLELPGEDRGGLAPDDARPARRWEEDYPADGLVLRSVARDLPLEPGGAPGVRWNRDHAWFGRGEARRFLPDEPRVGARHELPADLLERLARYHFVDNVRGQCVPFAASEVEEARVTVEVAAVDGARVELTLSGHVRSDAPGPWQMREDDIFKPRHEREYPHGIELDLLGTAAFDLDAGRFTAFELVARGERWGRTQNNGRARDLEPGPVGFVFSLAPPGPSGRVPPAFAQVYDAPWMDTPYAR